MKGRHVICFGNELHGDDGFGPRVYQELCALTWPTDVSIFNVGIAGLNALRYLTDCRQAILVDSLANAGHAGRIWQLTPQDLLDRKLGYSGHESGILYLLAALKVICDPLPAISIIGVEATAVTPFCIGLSPKTERAVGKTLRLIQEQLPA